MEFAQLQADYLLEPGYIFFSATPATVRTVLGTSVSVCMWDAEQRCGGMNHFIQPRAPHPDQATARYGDAATKALARMMREAECNEIEAQIFGGGAQDGRPETTETGLRNAEAARELLKSLGIKVIAEDVGGLIGRKVFFDTKSGAVAVLRVRRLRDGDWHGPEASKTS